MKTHSTNKGVPAFASYFSHSPYSGLKVKYARTATTVTTLHKNLYIKVLRFSPIYGPGLDNNSFQFLVFSLKPLTILNLKKFHLSWIWNYLPYPLGLILLTKQFCVYLYEFVLCYLRSVDPRLAITIL